MLKRRRKVQGNQSRAGVNRPSDIQEYQPTPDDIQNFETLSKLFHPAQITKTSHPKLLTKLLEVYKVMPGKDFERAFRACVRVPLISSGCNDHVNRTFLFVANFCASINDTEETGNLCQFNANFFSHLLQGSGDVTQSVRLRSCQLINALLQSLDADKGLEAWLADAIQEAMLRRMHDKSPQVRVQAVSALQRLQDPDNPECPVITSFLDSLRYDPCAEVRCRLLGVMARIKRTLSALVERHADKKDNVRRAALLVVSRLHMRSLKIAQREMLLNSALKDPSPAVRKCAETELLPWWLLNNDGDYFRFLNCLDVHTAGHMNVCQEALFALFRQAETADLLAVANRVLVGKLLPLEQVHSDLGPQMLVFWRCLAAFLREQGLDDDLETILPDLTPFAAYIRQVLLLGDNLPKDEDELDEWSFTCSELVTMAKGYDLGDEVGRTELRRTLLDLLIVNKSIPLASPLVALLEMTEPATDSRLTVLAELVSDLHKPLAPATQMVSEDDMRALNTEKQQLRYQIVELTALKEEAVEGRDYLRAKDLDDELTAKGQRLAQVNLQLLPAEEETVTATATRRDMTNPETLAQCLSIIVEMMQDPKVRNLTPQLLTLMQDFVEPVYQIHELSEPLRLLCLRCFGCFCLLDKQVALEKIPVFFVPIAEEGDSPCAVAALQAIFDLFFCYGLETFSLSTDIDERQELGAEGSPNAKQVNILDSMLCTLKDYDNPALVLVAATGFCKLLLAGHISSFRLLIALLLTWFHQAGSFPELRLVLSDFFTTYTSNRSDGLKLMVRCVLPLVDELLKPEEHDQLDISEVLVFVMSLTRPGINPKFHENVQLAMAEEFCDKIILEPQHERMPYLAQALARLDVSLGSAVMLESLRTKGHQLEPLVAKDRLAARFVTKFLSNVTSAETLLTDSEAVDEAVEEEETAVEAVAEGATERPEAPQPEGNAAAKDATEGDRMEIEDTDSSQTGSLAVQADQVLASSSPVDQPTASFSGLVIPETESESSEFE